MKNIFLCLIVGALVFQSCKNDDDTTIEEVSIDTQNSYDDQAILKYLDEHYLDERGKIVAFDSSDDADDNEQKLADMPGKVVLPSGVIYIVRADAQPNPGTTIGTTDIMRLMNNATTYVATKTDDVVSLNSSYPFIIGTSSGNIEVDPMYYYVKQSVLDDATADVAKQRSYYEIEGFQEAIKHFEAFDMPDSSDYNLQGVIIVPSRAAFSRDAHYNHSGYSFRNRSFIFNFQIYKTTPRT